VKFPKPNYVFSITCRQQANSRQNVRNKSKATFEIGCPELIPDIEKVLPVAISKWPPQYRTNSTLFDFKDISYVGRE
jgi:hypothetical protein